MRLWSKQVFAVKINDQLYYLSHCDGIARICIPGERIGWMGSERGINDGWLGRGGRVDCDTLLLTIRFFRRSDRVWMPGNKIKYSDSAILSWKHTHTQTRLKRYSDSVYQISVSNWDQVLLSPLSLSSLLHWQVVFGEDRSFLTRNPHFPTGTTDL